MTFNLLYVFVVLCHDRRRILHVNVTDLPTAAWTARQLLEALPQVTSQQVQNLIDYRADRDFVSTEEIRYLIGEQTFAVISPYITLALSPYYTIRAEGRVTDSSVKQIIQAMVKIDRELPAGYQIVSWQDQYY